MFCCLWRIELRSHLKPELSELQIGLAQFYRVRLACRVETLFSHSTVLGRRFRRNAPATTWGFANNRAHSGDQFRKLVPMLTGRALLGNTLASPGHSNTRKNDKKKRKAPTPLHRGLVAHLLRPIRMRDAGQARALTSRRVRRAKISTFRKALIVTQSALVPALHRSTWLICRKRRSDRK